MAKPKSINKIFVPVDQRPRCQHPGCNNPGQHTGNYRVDGTPMFRKTCTDHHFKPIVERYGVKNMVAVLAKKAGYASTTAYINSKHPYLKYRKTYCENIDGRLGFVCTTTIIWDGMLDVDHKDENPYNNDPENLQTLCKCCHAYKSNQFVKLFGSTPGRKQLKRQ